MTRASGARTPLRERYKPFSPFSRETRLHWLVAGVLLVACLFLFLHFDILETADHAAVFLESLFAGTPRDFYARVIQHQNSYIYLNNAHYNVTLYGLFALFELPAFLIYRAMGTLPPEALLGFIGKGVCALFYLGCVLVMPILGQMAGLSKKKASWAALFFALWPPAVFSTFVMGQYDVITLFFVLVALVFWGKNRLLWFSFFMGAAFSTKLFPVFLFVPLLLLREKRPLRLLLCLLVSLWLLAPTSLLYRGLTFDAEIFNAQMAARLFGVKLTGGREIPLFAVGYGISCVGAWFWRPDEEKMFQSGLWLSLCSLGLLFFFLDWHPQWIILIAPFVVLTTLCQKNPIPWFFVDIVLCAGYFLVAFAGFPSQMEGNLLDFGMVGQLTPYYFTGNTVMSFIMKAASVVGYLPTAVFSAALASHVLFKWPFRGGPPAQRLFGSAPFPGALGQKPLVFFIWAVFAVGFVGCWLLPTLVTVVL